MNRRPVSIGKAPSNLVRNLIIKMAPNGFKYAVWNFFAMLKLTHYPNLR